MDDSGHPYHLNKSLLRKTTMIKCEIRTEHASDHVDIYEVTRLAFLNAEHSSHTEHFIVNALHAQDALTISLVALVIQKVVGHIAISPVSIHPNTPHWFGLGPVSVLPEFQKCGIGTQLIQTALSQLREMNTAGCVLLGDPNYYAKFGFKVHPNLILEGMPPEYFQVLPFHQEIPLGKVSYSSEFNATS